MPERLCETRRAEKNDARAVWEIRNTPEARAVSFSQDPVPWESHEQWFLQEYFRGRPSECFVLECQGTPQGYCRFDWNEESKCFFLSIALSPALRGKGLGSFLLRESLAQLSSEARKIVARVKKSNAVSQTFFEKNGFEKEREDEGVIIYAHFIAPKGALGEMKQLIAKVLSQEKADLFETLLFQKPEKADVIVLLQGDRLDRVPAAVELYKQGFAPLVLISGNDARVQELNDVSLNELQDALQKKGVLAEDILLDSEAMNTAGQATNVIVLAKKRGWRKLLLVASAYHALRAFLTFQKEAMLQGWEGSIIMHAVYFPWESFAQGEKKTHGELFEEELQKIAEYL